MSLSAHCTVFLLPRYRFQIAAFQLLLHFALKIQHGWMLEKENWQSAFKRIDKFIYKVETFPADSRLLSNPLNITLPIHYYRDYRGCDRQDLI
jgi:hypothetical protein